MDPDDTESEFSGHPSNLGQLGAAHMPLVLGSEVAANRLGLAPISTGFIDDHGFPTGQYKSFHESYAKAGVGVIFIGGVAVNAKGRASVRSLALDGEDKSSKLRETINAVRHFGSVPIVQLMHSGRQTSLAYGNESPIAASALPCPVLGITPREMTKEEIRATVVDFRRAAEWAFRAGARVLEVHAAHGYLISGFMSPYSNVRQDCYGGSAHNRFRLLNEILAEITALRDVAVGVRISADEYVDGGLTAADLPDLVARLTAAGVSFISVSAGVYSREDRVMPPRKLGEGIYRHLGAIAKRWSNVPVMLAGNVTTLRSANEIIEQSCADLVLMGRALLSDPKLISKCAAGLETNLNRCSMCRLCKYNSRRLPHVVCPHNTHLKEMFVTTVRAIRATGQRIKAVPLS